MTPARPRPRTVALAVASAIISSLALGGVTRADDAGVSAGVEPLIELSIDPAPRGRVVTTVTTTVPRTRLDVSGDGATRAVTELARPVTRRATTVRVDRRASDVTFTLGPDGP